MIYYPKVYGVCTGAYKAIDLAYKSKFGKDTPKGYEYPEYKGDTKEENKPSEPPKPNEQKPSEPPKQEEAKSSEASKQEEKKPSESKPKPKQENKSEPSAKVGTVTVKRNTETATERAMRAYGIKRDAYKSSEIPKSRVKSLQNSGMTIKEIAEKLDISPSQVERILKEG